MPSKHFASFMSLGLITLAAALGCGSKGDGNSQGTEGGTGAGGGGGSGGAATCDTDYAKSSTGADVSLKNDLFPVFGLSCTASECHNSRDKASALFLGWKCKFDGVLKKCVFPAMVADGGANDVSQPQPLVQADVDAVHADLMAESKTAPGVKRVDPGKPGASFLLDKLAGTENDPSKPYHASCKNQAPTRTAANEVCGTHMPAVGKALCISGSTGQDKFNLFVRWVAQGAKNN